MFQIRNIKISVKVKPMVLNNVIKKLKDKGVHVKTYTNFLTFKSDNFTFVIFKKGKKKYTHINITQIPSFCAINKSLKIIINLIQCVIVKYIIDNIIATSDLQKWINLQDVINKKVFEKVKYNNEVFPGLFIKFNDGTVILFHSGKIVVVGCKNDHSIKCILEKIHANI